MNFLKSDVESMISYSNNNNRSYMGDNENVFTVNQEPKENFEEMNPMRNNNKVKVVSHNPQPLPQTKVVNETKSKVSAESKEKKKPATTGNVSNLTTTNSKKNVVPPKKK